MPLISDALEGWKISRIASPPPYHVEVVGPYNLPQVTDGKGCAALSGPKGAVFCASAEHANALCEAANNGQLPSA